MVLVSPAYAAKSQDNISTAQGCGAQILSAFVKQRTYHHLPTVITLIPSSQDIQENFLEGSAKFGSRRLEELPPKPRKFLRAMITLRCIRCLRCTLFPAAENLPCLPRLTVGAKSNGAYCTPQNNHHPPEDREFPVEGNSVLLDAIIRSR